MAERAPRGGVLWDLDGTIVDSAELHYLAWREALRPLGHEHTPEEFARTFGKRNDLILRDLFGGTLSAEEVDRLAEDKERRYRRLVRERGLEPLPGVTAWLGRLRDGGFRQALASSAPAANITVTLEVLGLGRFLDAVVSADEVGHGKPDPAIFLEAARRLGVPPARCVVVEDAPAGLEGARRAGMRSVGLLSAHHPKLEGDLVVPSLEALPPGAIEGLVPE
jgi:HAD superfamily hydrolase (TIGR01509 family)